MKKLFLFFVAVLVATLAFGQNEEFFVVRGGVTSVTNHFVNGSYLLSPFGKERVLPETMWNNGATFTVAVHPNRYLVPNEEGWGCEYGLSLTMGSGKSDFRKSGGFFITGKPYLLVLKEPWRKFKFGYSLGIPMISGGKYKEVNEYPYHAAIISVETGVFVQYGRFSLWGTADIHRSWGVNLSFDLSRFDGYGMRIKY